MYLECNGQPWSGSDPPLDQVWRDSVPYWCFPFTDNISNIFIGETRRVFTESFSRLFLPWIAPLAFEKPPQERKCEVLTYWNWIIGRFP